MAAQFTRFAAAEPPKPFSPVDNEPSPQRLRCSMA
jgi:hypothetical protein